MEKTRELLVNAYKDYNQSRNILFSIQEDFLVELITKIRDLHPDAVYEYYNEHTSTEELIVTPEMEPYDILSEFTFQFQHDEYISLDISIPDVCGGFNTIAFIVYDGSLYEFDEYIKLGE